MERKKQKNNLKQLKYLTLRNLKNKYASTFLGILWPGLIPLLLMAAVTFAFMKVLKLGDKNFPIFVLSGILPWLYFSNTIIESTQVFIKEKQMMHQFTFPKALFPISIILSNLIQHLIGLLFLLPIFIFYNLRLVYLFFVLIFPVLNLTIFLVAISTITAITNLYIRDLEHFLGVGLMILFWLTPVFYDCSMVPLNYRFIIYFNPLTYYIDFYRMILLKDRFFSLPAVLATVLIAFGSLILVWFIFSKIENSILKKI